MAPPRKRPSASPGVILLLVVAAAISGCVDIDGGAVEARWDLQYGGEDCTPPGGGDPLCVRGNRISCARGKVGFVELSLDPLRGSDDPCDREGTPCRFSCEPLIGTTRFFIPEGDYSISLQVRDPAGTLLGPADGVAVPAPIVRQVLEGQLTNLNVNLIIVQACDGC
jgi:hypothetical protein